MSIWAVIGCSVVVGAVFTWVVTKLIDMHDARMLKLRHKLIRERAKKKLP
ncbi:hypothetical protein VPHF86_0123 [Vibrio phage F86]